MQGNHDRRAAPGWTCENRSYLVAEFLRDPHSSNYLLASKCSAQFGREITENAIRGQLTRLRESGDVGLRPGRNAWKMDRVREMRVADTQSVALDVGEQGLAHITVTIPSMRGDGIILVMEPQALTKLVTMLTAAAEQEFVERHNVNDLAQVLSSSERHALAA